MHILGCAFVEPHEVDILTIEGGLFLIKEVVRLILIVLSLIMYRPR